MPFFRQRCAMECMFCHQKLSSHSITLCSALHVALLIAVCLIDILIRMCLNGIIYLVLAVTLWHEDSAAASKCSGFGLESWLAGHLGKGGYK